jgi:hypothetical protein
MFIGASTANFYPALTEDALQTLLAMGFRELEIFVNTESEIRPAYLRGLKERVQAHGARVRALHPYLSGIEPYLLFSAYERRYRDGLEIYARLFEAAALLGADFVVMHGDKAEGVLPVEDSVARYEGVYDAGRRFGVTLAQENVVRFRSSDNGYLRAMRRLLGKKAHFVFDIKQCRRCGHSPESVLAAMGDAVAHVHISDGDDRRDCLVPGQGREDFFRLFRLLRGQGFDGAVMLELYRSNFGKAEELAAGRRVLEQAADGV